MDDKAKIISYEEYTPYGSTSYQAVDQSIKVAAKRYRYTGKERDEETGFSYHGARYYAPWVGRWTAADPAGIVAGVNSYMYSAASPVCLVDRDGLQAGPPHPEDTDIHQYWKEAPASRSGQVDSKTSSSEPQQKAPAGCAAVTGCPGRGALTTYWIPGANRTLDLAGNWKESAHSQFSFLTPQAVNAAQQPQVYGPPAPPAPAIKPVPSTSDLPSPDRRDRPGPTRDPADPTQKGPSLALAPKPNLTGDPATATRQPEVSFDVTREPGQRLQQNGVTPKKGDLSDITDQKPISDALGQLQNKFEAQLEKDFGQPGETVALIIVGGIFGGGLWAGTYSSKQTTPGDERLLKPEDFGNSRKLIVFKAGNIKFRPWVDLGNATPPDPNATPVVNVPDEPRRRVGIGVSFDF